MASPDPGADRAGGGEPPQSQHDAARERVFVIADDYQRNEYPYQVVRRIEQRVFATEELANEFVRERDQYDESLLGIDGKKRVSSRVQGVPVQTRAGEAWDGKNVHLVFSDRGRVINSVGGEEDRVEAAFASEEQAWEHAEQLVEREPELRKADVTTRHSRLGRVGVAEREVKHETPRMVDMWHVWKHFDGKQQDGPNKIQNWSDAGTYYSGILRPGIPEEWLGFEAVAVVALSPDSAVRIAEEHIAERQRKGLTNKEKLAPRTSPPTPEEIRRHVAEQIQARAAPRQSDTSERAREIAEKAKTKQSRGQSKGMSR